MENPSHENQTCSTTEQETDDRDLHQTPVLAGIDGDVELSIDVIAHEAGIDPKLVRRYLYRGVLGSTKASDVRDWLNHHQPNLVCRGSRIDRGRVFNKWRN